MAQGNLPEALESFRNQLEITEQLARGADTDDNGWQRDRTIAYDRVGDVLMQGKLSKALDFRHGLEIQSGSQRPIPTTRAGNAVCRCPMIVSGTCWWRRASCSTR